MENWVSLIPVTSPDGKETDLMIYIPEKGDFFPSK